MNETLPHFDPEKVAEFVKRDRLVAIGVYNLLNSAVRVDLGSELEFTPGAQRRLHHDRTFGDLLTELGISVEEISPCFINALWIVVRNALVAKT